MYQIQRRVFDCISEPLKKRLEIRGVGQGLLGTYNVKGTHSFKCLVACETSGGNRAMLDFWHVIPLDLTPIKSY